METKLTKSEIEKYIKKNEDKIAIDLLNEFDKLDQNVKIIGNNMIDKIYYFNDELWSIFYTVKQKGDLPNYIFERITDESLIYLSFTQFKIYELSNSEIERHISKTNDSIAIELYNNIENFTQEIEYIEKEFIYKKYYFIDKRGATMFLIEQSGAMSKPNYEFKRYFNAPSINYDDFKNILPLNSKHFIVYDLFEYKASTKLFYSDEKTAFNIPIIDILNNKLNYTAKDIYYLNHSYIEAISMELNPDANEFTISFDIDRYAGINLLYNSISLKYKLTLNSFDIISKEEKHFSYNSK